MHAINDALLRPSVIMDTVFTYGSLMFDEVWNRVANGRYRKQDATLHGFIRKRLRQAVYPAIVRGSERSIVNGVVYHNVSTADLDRLDTFEGNYYQRCIGTIVLSDGSMHGACFYVLRDRYCQLLSDDDWDPGSFRQYAIREFFPE